MNIIRQLTKSVLTACVPREWLIVRGPRSTGRRPRLALSFDDGPHPNHTPPLLDLLEELDLRATFFVVGRNAERHREIVRRMAAAGHEIANHTYSHLEPLSTSADVFFDEIHHTDQLLRTLSGRIPSMVRPPKGDLNWAKLRGLWKNNKTVALWNVDAKDYRMTSPDEMARWCRAYRPKDGDIVLLHDNRPFAIHAVRMMAANGVFERFEATTIGRFLGRADIPVTHLAGT